MMGLKVALRLSGSVPDAELAQQALLLGLVLVPLSMFYVGGVA